MFAKCSARFSFDRHPMRTGPKESNGFMRSSLRPVAERRGSMNALDRNRPAGAGSAPSAPNKRCERPGTGADRAPPSAGPGALSGRGRRICARRRAPSSRCHATAFLRLAEPRRVAGDRRHAGHGRARAGGPRRRFRGRGDRQPVGKTNESGGVCGFGAGKRIKGRKRLALTDTLCLPVGLVFHQAGVRDRAGTPEMPPSVRMRPPWPRRVRADGGYTVPTVRAALHGAGGSRG